MAIASRFFSEVTIPASGIEIQNILGGVEKYESGYLNQIIIQATSGGGSTANVQVRYDSGDNSPEVLIYYYEDGSLPLFVDSFIEAPFDLKAAERKPDLHLFIQPESSGVFEIRLDFDLDIIKNK